MAKNDNENTGNNTDVNTGEVQEKIQTETDQGFRGTEVDPTPNENYTSVGQGKGLQTPESDPELADAARKAVQGR